MSIPDLSGTWQGTLTYGEAYPEHLREKVVPFTLHLKLHDGDIEGQFEDDETLKIFGKPAEVEGFLEEAMISFVKRYPCFFAYTEDGSVYKDESRYSHEVMYNGDFNPEDGSFKGVWEIVADVEESYKGTTEYLLSGEWQMTRKS
jgi:hypothetical protein